MTTDRFVCLTNQLNFADLGEFSGPTYHDALQKAYAFAYGKYDVMTVVSYSTAETMRNQLNAILPEDE